MVRRLWWCLVVAVGLVVALPPRGADAEPLRRVRVGGQPVLGAAGIYMAVEKGYFGQEGIDVQLASFRAASEAIPLLATGQLDVVTGTLSAAFVNAYLQGVPMKIVASVASVLPGKGFNALVVRRDLHTQGVLRRVRDLRGRRIATVEPEGVPGFMLERMLQSDGLQLRDVELVRMLFEDMPGALRQGAVDAALMAEPLVSVSTASLGSGTVLITADQVLRAFPLAVVFYGPTMLRNPELATGWMTGYLKGLRDSAAALDDPRLRETLVEVLAKYTPLKDRAMYALLIWPGWSDDGLFDTGYLQAVQEFLAARGTIPRVVPTDELVDFRFVERAARALGLRATR